MFQTRDHLKTLWRVAFSAFSVFICLSVAAGNEPTKRTINTGDTLKNTALLGLQLDKDEAIKCTRAELLSKEFITIGTKNYPELLRITFQDLERGSREIIFQKKINESDEVKFTMPQSLIKETAMAVLIVMKGEGMFFKKIDIID